MGGKGFPQRFGPDVQVDEVDLDQEVIHVEEGRLTEARATVLAEEAERTSNLVPGGKSLSGGAKHSPMINVRVADSLKLALEKEAKSKGMGTSKLVRKILEDHVRQSG